MAYKITDFLKDSLTGIWSASIVEYDPLPFGNKKQSFVTKLEAGSYSELLNKIASEGWFDKINN